MNSNNLENTSINDLKAFVISGITLEDPNLFIFPKSKKEQISFKFYDFMTLKQISVIARRNVKYYLKKKLHAREWWSFEGYFNQDKTTFYVSKATLTLNKEQTLKAINHFKQIQLNNLTKTNQD